MFLVLMGVSNKRRKFISTKIVTVAADIIELGAVTCHRLVVAIARPVQGIVHLVLYLFRERRIVVGVARIDRVIVVRLVLDERIVPAITNPV